MVFEVNEDNQQKLTVLYADHKPLFVSLMNRYVHNFSTAEDIVQEAFTKAYTTLTLYDGSRSSVKTWFSKVLFSTLWNYKRKNKKIPVMLDITDILTSFELTTEASDSQDWIRERILNVENEEHRLVLFSYYILGYQTQEIEMCLGVKPDNCRKIVQRFKTLLVG